MIGFLAAAILAALAVPHLLAQSRLAPTTGIALWLAVLSLRAVVALALALIAILFLPATQLFQLLTHWCVHAVIPFFATHLGFDGHRLGDAAVLVPAVILAASLFWAGVGVWRGARTVHRWLRSSSLGAGPRASVIVGGSDVVVAAAGIRSPRVVVSAGALVHLDDAELAAGLEHEWGHIARHHRFISVLGELLRAISRPLPGGARALEALGFHLERDADEFAVSRTGDPVALASAICKAVSLERPATPALTALGGPGVPDRLRFLLADAKPTALRSTTALARLAIVGAAALALLLVSSAPAVAGAGIDQLGAAQSAGPDCPA